MKRLLTYLSAIIIMMMVPIGAQAWTHVYLQGDLVGGWSANWELTKLDASGNQFSATLDATSLTNGTSYTFKINASDDGGKWWGDGSIFDFSSQSSHEETFSKNNGNMTLKHNSLYSSYTITANYTNSSGNWEWTLAITGNTTATTATLSIPGESPITSTQTAAPFHFYIPEGSYTKGDNLTFTVKTVQGSTTTYYGNSTTFAEGPKAYNVTSSSSSNTCTYAVPSNATGTITVSLLENLTELVIAHQTSGGGGGGGTTTEAAYYLVGNFMHGESDINYSYKIFRMKPIGNSQYSFDIPATLDAKFQIVNQNGDKYGPQAGGNSWNLSSSVPENNGTRTGNMTGTNVTNTSNYWKMTSRGLSSDGMYTVTITVDNSGVPTNWSIKHDQLTRVAYFLPNPSEHSNATAQPCYSKRNNNTSAGSNKYFGNFYLEQGKHAYVVSNITLDADNNNNSLLKTVNKLYLQGNGGGTPESGSDNDTKVYPHQTTGFRFNNTVAITLEYNPSKGTESNLQSSDYRIGGEILKGRSNQLDITSMAVIGNGVGTDWDLNNARAMTYNSELKCWEITITTTAAESTDNLFRFVANGSWDINWYENGTANTDKARVPYTGTGDGHAATEADVNVVEKTNDAHATTARDIIFNRPAGEWTIRFYTEATSTQGGNYFSYNFYYTITGTENPDPSVVTTTIKTTGGLYINKVLVEVAYTGDSNKPLYWKVGGAPTTSDNLVSYTDSENNTDNRKFLLSTPGQLYVGDGTNTSAPVTFDFTYSTSENYAGVENNGTYSQTVTSQGGKDCVNVFFKKSYKDMSIYVWDAYAEHGSEYLTKVWPGQWMSDDRTLTLNGETFYYVSFPTSDLVEKAGKFKIGFILSNAALGSSKENADATKTRDYFLEFNATATEDKGVQETMFYALEANVTANKVYDPEGSTYESQEKSTYKGSAAQLFSTNTVYFKNDQNWTSPIYCHVWKADGSKLHDWKSNGEMMTLVDAANKIYAYTIPTDYQVNLKFGNSSETGDLTFSGNGGKMYTASTSSWGDAPSSFTTLDAASLAVMNTFLTTPPVKTVEFRVYPNGQDYYRNMPNDYTLMLSKDWEHLTDPVDEQSWQSTSGSHWSGSTTKTYLHIYNNTAYQTVKNLPKGTYTVQTLVRGGALPIYLDLNDTQVASIRLTSDGADAKTTINKFGRSEQLVEMSTDNGKRGWHKLEGTVTLATAGDLKIAVRTDNGGSIDLADVFLLKDANNAGNYWTTAPTSETVTEYDMSDRSKYNAFSFFDRGANLNSIIKADQKTVIGMSEDNEPYLTGAEKGARRHPCNVVTSSDGTTWSTPMLALTDYATVIEGSEAKYGNNQYVSQHAYGTTFAYTADKFSYDRATSAKMMSTMLPFALSNEQVKSMLGSGVKTYTLGNIDKSNLKVTFNVTTDNLEAHTPFFFLPLQSETKSKMALDESVSVVATSATSSPSLPAEGLLGTYKHISNVGTTYKAQDFIPYFYQNNIFVWADNDANAKPFRVIFLLNKKGNEARMLNAIFVDDTTTGIDGITENIQQDAPVYSIDGKLVSSDGDTSRLSKGVYVKAGKKFIIK